MRASSSGKRVTMCSSSTTQDGGDGVHPAATSHRLTLNDSPAPEERLLHPAHNMHTTYAIVWYILYIPVTLSFFKRISCSICPNTRIQPPYLCRGYVALHCPQQVETFVLDYDENSLITIFDQTSGFMFVYKGVEVRQRNRTPNNVD